jgi:hypothetical protein
MTAYHSGNNECSIIHDGVIRKLLDDTMKKLIDPERHCIDQDENRQLDADQNREKILQKKIDQNMRLERSTGLDSTLYIRKTSFGGPTRLKVLVRYV